jgi:DNA gyrase subunit B
LYDVREIGTTEKRGTVINFLPDDTIFETAEYKYDILAHRLRELSFLNKGLTLTLVDEREKDEDGFKRETFHSEGGLQEFVLWIDEAKQRLIEKPIYITARGERHVICK